MIMILLGAPGSGKGTQAKFLAGKYGFRHLATGDIFRSEIAAKSALGLKAQEYVKSGKLVPDRVVTEMVAGKIEFDGGHYLLDGFPRTLQQAHALADFLGSHKAAIDLVLYLDLAQAEVLKRLGSRRVCLACGEAYNAITRPPAAEGKCDKCGGQVIQREDDTEATIKKRLMVFEDLTHPLVAYYKGEGIFHDADGAQSPEQVTAALCAVIDKVLVRS